VKIKDQVKTTMAPGWPAPDADGDRRDIHDKNPNEGLNIPHDRSARDPKNDFQEGLNGSHYRGPVHKVAEDILSSPMNSKRSATGERETELSKKQGY
jgi:hypothetical protein